MTREIDNTIKVAIDEVNRKLPDPHGVCRMGDQTYAFEPYDVLQITYDNGNRWDDWASLRTEAEGMQGAYRTKFTQGQSQRYRITRNQCVIYGI
jgi:hypothetical protein